MINTLFFTLGCLVSVVLIGVLTGHVWACQKLPVYHEYDNMNCLSEGLAGVKKDNKWGFIDNTGKVIIDFEYDYSNYFIMV